MSALDVAKTLLLSRINVPYLTSFVEKTILGGKSLTLLRLIALCAAIPKVLEEKLASSNTRDLQATSFADELPLGTWGRWLNELVQHDGGQHHFLDHHRRHARRSADG